MNSNQIAEKRGGRTNQKLRTRKLLLETAAAILNAGKIPSLDDVAELAMVSRATAYRYFPNVEALLLEASVHVQAPQPEDVFDDNVSVRDPLTRLQQVESAFHEMVLANESQLRVMLAQTLQQGVAATTVKLPIRQNRRQPLIEMALAPAKSEFTPANYKRLCLAAALIIGPEAMIVCKDVLRIDEAEARKLKQWAIKALVEAARREPKKQ